MNRHINDDNYIEDYEDRRSEEGEEDYEDRRSEDDEEVYGNRYDSGEQDADDAIDADYFDEGYLDEDDLDTAAYARELESKNHVKNRDTQGRGRGTVPWKKVLLIGGGALIGIYLLVAVFMIGRFPFHTTLNGNDVSLKKPAEVEQALTESAAGYSLAVTGRAGASDMITAAEISLDPQFDGTVETLQKSLNPFAWPLQLFTKTELESGTVVSYDSEALTKAIDGLSCFDADKTVAPKDASCTWDGTKFTIVPEEQGSEADKAKVTEAVTLAVNGLQTSLDLDAAGCYKTPAVTADDPELIAKAESLNALVTADLTLDMGAGETLTLDGNTLMDWINVSEDGTASLDADKVASYVKDLAEQYNTIYQNRTFKTHDGNTITTSGGSYGWWLDENGTIEAIRTAFTDGTHAAKAVWNEEPKARGDNSACGNGSFGGDIGSTYVEVDLDAQRVYMWVNGSCVLETDCVSGKAAAGNGTPDGVYPITYKEKDATLVGENYSSDVSYWMPFNGNVGLHDAPWRSSFGGDIYVSSGSHGCVNLPVSAAASLFGYVEKGLPVVVYGGMTQAQATAYLGSKVDADTAAEAAANAQYLANANAVAATYGIDTTGASVNADGSVSYAIGATIYPDGHITGADGSTIVEAPSAASAGDASAAADAGTVDATAAAQAAQEAAAAQAEQGAAQ